MFERLLPSRHGGRRAQIGQPASLGGTPGRPAFPPFRLVAAGLVIVSRLVGSFAADWERVTGSRKRAQHLLVGRIAAGGSGFEENLNNAVNHFELLWVGLCENRINALADISWLFFSFQEQKSAWGQSKTFGHGDDRVQAWHFVATFHIPPEVSCDIASLRGVFQAEILRESPRTNW